MASVAAAADKAITERESTPSPDEPTACSYLEERRLPWFATERVSTSTLEEPFDSLVLDRDSTLTPDEPGDSSYLEERSLQWLATERESTSTPYVPADNSYLKEQSLHWLATERESTSTPYAPAQKEQNLLWLAGADGTAASPDPGDSSSRSLASDGSMSSKGRWPFVPVGRLLATAAAAQQRRSQDVLSSHTFSVARDWLEPSCEPAKVPASVPCKTKSRNKISWSNSTHEPAVQASPTSTTQRRPAPLAAIDLERHYIDWRLRSGTTVMVQNLPEGMTQNDFAKIVNRWGFLSVCNFLYMPACFNSGRTNGYAFVNLLDKALAIDFVLEVEKNGLQWSRANVQGVGPLMDDMRRRHKRVRNTKFLPMFPLGVQQDDATSLGWM